MGEDQVTQNDVGLPERRQPVVVKYKELEICNIDITSYR